MSLFALPKTLTDLVKAFKSAAAGRVLRKGPAGWEFLDPSQTWASQGIFVSTAEPELVSYAQWAATGVGYWAWVDVSSALGATEVASSGGAVLSGSSPIASGSAPASSGGAVISGSPLISCGVLTAGSGGPVLSGTATVSMGSAGSVIVSSMGGIVSGGVSVPLRGVVALPAGGAVLSGSALSAKGSTTSSTGGAILSGAASVIGAAGAASVSVTSTGGAVLSGTAPQTSGRVSVASGGAVMSGAASVVGTPGASAPTQPVISATGGDTTVTIALTNVVTGATSYDLKWGTSAGSRPNTIAGVTLPYTHTGRTNGTTYYYSLVAVNAQGSVESAEVYVNAGKLAVTDDFNRANGLLGSNWLYSPTATYQPTILNSAVVDTNFRVETAALWNASFAVNQYAEAYILMGSPTGGTLGDGVIVRGSGADRADGLWSGYFLGPVVDEGMGTYDTSLIVVFNGGVYQLLITVPGTAMKYLRLEASGSTITAKGKVNAGDSWTTIAAVTDTLFTTGAVGIHPTNGLDDWKGGDL